MKKTVLLLGILLLLVIAFWQMNQRSDDRMVELMKDRSFKIEQLDEVKKIVISPKGYKSTTLIKDGGEWKLNGEQKVRENPMNNLLDVLNGIQVQYIPERAAYDNILRDMDKISVQIEAFDGDGDRLKSYYLGGVTTDERGTYAIMDGYRQPYVVEMANFEGSIRNRFLIKDIDWLDRTVFKADPEDIVEIRIDYPKDKNESFTAVQSDKGYYISESPKATDQAVRAPDQNKLKAYFQGYDLLMAEYIENENPKRDSISRLVPFADISVTMKDDSVTRMQLFPVKDLLFEKKSTVELEQQKYINRYFLKSSSGDFFLVQQRLVGKFLRGYSFLANAD